MIASPQGILKTRPARAPVFLALSVVALAVASGALLRPIAFVDMVIMDDMTLIPGATGAARLTDELLAPVNGHRLVLPKLLEIAAIWLSGGRLWAPRFLGLVALAASCWIFLRLARQARGRLGVVDAVVPLLFLSPRLVSTFVHAFDLQFALHTSLLGLALLSAWNATRGVRGSLFGTALSLVALSLCGINGLVASAVFAPFVAAYAFDWDDEPARQRARWGAPLLVGSTWLLAGTLLTWEPSLRGSGGEAAKWKTAIEFFAMGFGPAGGRFWPLSGWIAAATLTAIVAAALRGQMAEGPAERRRTRLLFGALLATLSVGAAIGWGRAGWGGITHAGLGERFTLLASGTFALGHVVLVRATLQSESKDTGKRRVGLATVTAWLLLALLVGALPVAFADARLRAARFLEVTHRITTDARGGTPIATLAQVHESIHGHARDQLAWYLALLCEHHLGPYRGLDPKLAHCEVAALEPRTLETSAGGVEVVEVPYVKLGQHDGGCDAGGERHGPSCTRASRAFCRAHGHDDGFGPVENTGPIAIVICHRGRKLEVTWADLTRIDAECTPADGSPGACWRATHRACVATGARTGLFVPPGPGGPDGRFDLTCVDARLDLPEVDFEELEHGHGACYQPADAWSGDCAAAVHRVCRSRGAIAGFGPLLLEGRRATLGCLLP